MNNEKRSEYFTRDALLQLLSDDEVASVSTAETADRLADGEEYLDLEKLDDGVRRATGTTALMGRVLPRKAVQAHTWERILLQLDSRRIAPPHSGT